MDSTKFSKPISLKRIQLDGGFWKPEMELVRKEVKERLSILGQSLLNFDNL